MSRIVSVTGAAHLPAITALYIIDVTYECF